MGSLPAIFTRLCQCFKLLCCNVMPDTKELSSYNVLALLAPDTTTDCEWMGLCGMKSLKVWLRSTRFNTCHQEVEDTGCWFCTFKELHSTLHFALEWRSWTFNLPRHFINWMFYGLWKKFIFVEVLFILCLYSFWQFTIFTRWFIFLSYWIMY